MTRLTGSSRVIGGWHAPDARVACTRAISFALNTITSRMRHITCAIAALHADRQRIVASVTPLAVATVSSRGGRMHEALTTADLARRSDRSRSRSHRPRPIVLWHLRGATDDLRGLVVETSFGYALGLELDAELVSLQLHLTLEGLVADAERLEAALVAQGWQVVPDALDASALPPNRRSS